MIANRTQLADIFGVAKTTIDAWVLAGCPVLEKAGKGIPSRYDTAMVHNWVVAEKSGGNILEMIEEERHRKLKRENDIEEKLVAPVSLLTDALEKSGNIIVPILESLPLKMKQNFPELTGDQITLVKTAIAECRNAIADMEITP